MKVSSSALRRTALCTALSLSLASGAAFAQSAVGSIFGDAKAGATISIQNIGSGVQRTATADGNGRYAFSQLPPGDYRVVSDGITRDIHVQVGTGARVSFASTPDPTSLETVVVQGTNVNPIDVSSVESTTVFSFQQLQKIPVTREVSSVALLAPGTVKGDATYGQLVSIGGSSVAENGYYINGFDITNMRNLLSYFDMPYEATSEIQIKTGTTGQPAFARSVARSTTASTTTAHSTSCRTSVGAWKTATPSSPGMSPPGSRPVVSS